MISRDEYIRLSLELNLFFVRIFKEHSFFLQAAFVCKDTQLIQEANNFRLQYEQFLAETAALANGVVSPAAVGSGEFVTQYTLNAERATQFFTGVPFNFGLTQAEEGLSGSSGMMLSPALEQRVFMLNQKGIMLTNALLQFKQRILNDVVACKLFTLNYPLLIDHIMREAQFYLVMVNRLQRRVEIDTQSDLLEQEVFWNRIMAEHAKFIRGLLDPTEEALISKANDFGNEFDQLTRKAAAATEQTALLPGVTNESLKAAKEIKDFKAAGTKGLIDCEIKSIIIPLLGDHVLREASHYLRILQAARNRK